MKNNEFDADEVIKQKDLTPPKIEQVNLSEEKYLKLFELNDEGLRLYGQYKKEQMWTILKWSCLGTALGYSFCVMMDIVFKNMKNPKRDIIQSGIFIASLGFFTYTGLQISTINFRQKQNILIEKYGKEINNF
jgi:hypothetical protein